MNLASHDTESQRMETAIARVYVNDVEVGSMPEAQYRAIIDEVHANRWLRVRELLNGVWQMVRAIAWAIARMPVWLLGVVCVLLVALPQEHLTTLIEQLRGADAAQLTADLRTALLAIVGPSVFGLAAWRIGYGPGADAELHQREIDDRIRAIMECPAEGRVRVHIHKGNAVHVQ